VSSGDASSKQMLMQVAVMRKTQVTKKQDLSFMVLSATHAVRRDKGRNEILDSVYPKQSPPEIHMVGPISCPLVRIHSLKSTYVDTYIEALR
jgi:hypothetical protein